MFRQSSGAEPNLILSRRSAVGRRVRRIADHVAGFEHLPEGILRWSLPVGILMQRN